jgi:hypothetical protein
MRTGATAAALPRMARALAPPLVLLPRVTAAVMAPGAWAAATAAAAASLAACASFSRCSAACCSRAALAAWAAKMRSMMYPAPDAASVAVPALVAAPSRRAVARTADVFVPAQK